MTAPPLPLLQDVLNLIRERRTDEAKRLIDKDHSLMEQRDESGRTVLHNAAVVGLLPLVELAITEAKQDINDEDSLGWTPLMIASSSGKEEIVRYLLSFHQTNVSHMNNNGQTPLHYACSKGHSKIVSMLIENGADLNGRDKYGATPLHRASSQGRDDIVKILVSSAGIKIDSKDGEGKTPLYHACEEGCTQCIIYLVMAGADGTIEDTEGKSPCDVVKNEETGRVLIETRKKYKEMIN